MNVLLLSFLAFLLTVGYIEAQPAVCSCNLYIVTKGTSDSLYRIYAPWRGECSDPTADEDCSKACFEYASSMTNEGDLNSRPMGSSGPTLGDLACQYIGEDLPLTTFEYTSKVCSNAETNPERLPTKQAFCCKDGKWPNGDC